MVAKVRATPAPKADRLETLVTFGLVVKKPVWTSKGNRDGNYLSNPILLQELVDKLPPNIKFSWALYQEQQPVVNLRTFGDYMGRVTAATSGVTNICPPTKPQKDEKPRTKEKAYVNTHATYEKKKPRSFKSEQSSNTNSSGSSEKKGCPMCKSHEHIAEKCAEFTMLSVNERWKFVEMKLCRKCLVAHIRWPCEGEVCGVQGCQKRHHRLLHYVPEPEKPLATTNWLP
nr:uncharacterized protein LOC115255877 [Aedes albopictus]